MVVESNLTKSDEPVIRNERYDVFRAVAVTLVLLVHFSQNFAQNSFFAKFYPMFDLGKHGVKLFFVLSGLLMMQSLRRVKPNRSNYFRYIGKRFLRIYPAYFVSLGILFVFSDKDAFQLVTHLFLVHTISANTFGGINYAYWSLSVEFIIYFLLPYFIWRVSNRKKIAVWAIICLTSACWQILGGFLRERHHFDQNYNLSSLLYVLTALPAFVFGMYFKELNQEPKVRQLINLLVAAALFDVVLSFVDCFVDNSLFTYSNILMHGSVGYICYGALFGKLINSNFRFIGVGKPAKLAVIKVGQISYSIYLWHLPLLLLGADVFGTGVLSILITTGAIVGVSYLSFKFLEQVGIRSGYSILRYEYIGTSK